MADEPTPTQSSPSPTQGRRSSFAGQTFADLFGTRRSSVTRIPGPDGNDSPPSAAGPITTAAVQAQRRRMSLTTLGLSASPESASRFNALRGHRDSVGSANSGSIDESAIEDDVTSRDPGAPTPFARRMSFGARALRDVRNSAGGPGGGNTGQNGEGFNWSDNLRTRAERTSIAGQGGLGMPTATTEHTRAKSVAVMEPPIKEIPKMQQRPDHFQERILKGDFYMD